MIAGAPAGAVTYYVDNKTGRDSNNGLSRFTPFLTIQHAIGLTNPGDFVDICPGDGYGTAVHGGAIMNINRSGSASGGYITYQGCSGEAMPLIGPTDDSFTAIQMTAPISYIRIQGLNIAGKLASLTFEGAWINASNPSTSVSNATYNNGGISIFASRPSFIYLAPSSTVRAGTTLAFDSSPVSAGIVVGDAVYYPMAPGAIPTGTVVTSTSSRMVTLSMGVTGTVTSGQNVQFEHVAHHIQILRNVVHDFPGGGIGVSTADHIMISGNIVYNTAQYSVYGESGISIYSIRDVDNNSSTYKNFINGNVVKSNLNDIATHTTCTSGTTNGQTSSDSNVLHFASAPGGLRQYEQVYDTTRPTNIPAGTLIAAGGVGGSTVTMTNNVVGAVEKGDTINFCWISDGNGIIIDDGNNDQHGTAPYIGRTQIQNNLAICNGGAGILSFNTANVDINYNTAYLNSTNILLGGRRTDITVSDISQYNNFSQIGGSVFNNVIYSSATAYPILDVTRGIVQYGYNLIYGGNGTAPLGSNNIIGADPLFVAASTKLPVFSAPPKIADFIGFQIKPGSPAIEAAISATYTRSTDILGNPSPNGSIARAMGAFESPSTRRQYPSKLSTPRSMPR